MASLINENNIKHDTSWIDFLRFKLDANQVKPEQDCILANNSRSQEVNISNSFCDGVSKQQSLFSAFPNPITITSNYFSDLFAWISTFEDPRVDSWPLMSNSSLVVGLFFLYLVAANYGPSLMKNRPAFKLRLMLIVYNMYIALLNLWLVCELLYCTYMLNYRSLCQLVKPHSQDPYEMRLANVVWWYFASKGFEFADTMFFVLRKKDRQLSFLHKYHHSTMFLIWWTAARYVPGGSAIVPIAFNSFVHVLMYSYYGLSAIGPSMTKFLWWKKYLTMIQLIQFFIGISIGFYLIITGCQFTRWMQYLFSVYAFSFIILFGNFYSKEYKKTSTNTIDASKKYKKNNIQDKLM